MVKKHRLEIIANTINVEWDKMLNGKKMSKVINIKYASQFKGVNNFIYINITSATVYPKKYENIKLQKSEGSSLTKEIRGSRSIQDVIQTLQ